MAKVRLTKNDLKTQRDALKRFKRFLPTLELKKKQLIQEIKKIEDMAIELDQHIQQGRDRMARFARLLSEEVGLLDLVRLKQVLTRPGNIAGVPIPLFVDTEIELNHYNLFEMPLWVDAAVEQIVKLLHALAERGIIEQQLVLLRRELKTTIQRVNLFEKIKIPECKNNIRRIQIYLGDQQTNSVVRGKISKVKLCRAAAT
ncbi:MAG: V-type ATP synthase subunit D [Betaproteobacteria bacterium ADurb.Bin341]|nr:MAG: V-type ATP synthase subunit D [Betaproteobacteria bacterium ADurb.Bin341]